MSRDYVVSVHLPAHMEPVQPKAYQTTHSGPNTVVALFVADRLKDEDGWRLVSNGKKYPAQHENGRLIRTTMFEIVEKMGNWGASVWVKEDLGPYIW